MRLYTAFKIIEQLNAGWMFKIAWFVHVSHVEWVEMETELMEKLFNDQFPFHPRTTNGNYIHGNEVSVLNLSVLPISQSCFNI